MYVKNTTAYAGRSSRTESGRPHDIHVAKLRSTAAVGKRSLKTPTRTPFGAVPINVPSPPTLLAHAIPTSSPTPNFCAAARWLGPSPATSASAFSITPSANGTSIIVVEVLRQNIDITHATTMNAARSTRADEPNLTMMDKAKRLCRFEFSMAKSTRNAPRSRNVM